MRRVNADSDDGDDDSDDADVDTDNADDRSSVESPSRLRRSSREICRNSADANRTVTCRRSSSLAVAAIPSRRAMENKRPNRYQSMTYGVPLEYDLLTSLRSMTY